MPTYQEAVKVRNDANAVIEATLAGLHKQKADIESQIRDLEGKKQTEGKKRGRPRKEEAKAA